MTQPLDAGFALEDWQIRLVLPHRPPMLQLDRVEHCVPGDGVLEASKAVSGTDPMLCRSGTSPSFLAAGAVIEALAQCCGLLLRLRWLADEGADLGAFAGGDTAQLDGRTIPRSVLAESQAQFAAPIRPGQMLRLTTQLVLSRGDMHRFKNTAYAASESISAQIMLKFPSLG